MSGGSTSTPTTSLAVTRTVPAASVPRVAARCSAAAYSASAATSGSGPSQLVKVPRSRIASMRSCAVIAMEFRLLGTPGPPAALFGP